MTMFRFGAVSACCECSAHSQRYATHRTMRPRGLGVISVRTMAHRTETLYLPATGSQCRKRRPAATYSVSWRAAAPPHASHLVDRRKVPRGGVDVAGPARSLCVGRQSRRSRNEQSDRENACDFAHRIAPSLCAARWIHFFVEFGNYDISARRGRRAGRRPHRVTVRECFIS